MRIRLATKLTLLLISTILIVLLVMSAILSWSLRNGFEHYLKAQDFEQLQLFVAEAAKQAARFGEGSLAGGSEVVGRWLTRHLERAPVLVVRATIPGARRDEAPRLSPDPRQTTVLRRSKVRIARANPHRLRLSTHLRSALRSSVRRAPIRMPSDRGWPCIRPMAVTLAVDVSRTGSTPWSYQ